MDTIPVYNPSNGSILRRLTAHTAGDVGSMVRRASSAQNAWALRPHEDRRRIISRFSELLVERADQLALTLSTETGKPISQARNEILATPPRVNYFIEHAAQHMVSTVMQTEPTGTPVPGVGAMEEIVTYEPLGVVANISAWNYPYFVGSNVFVPALLTGNAVIYKPSEFALLTGQSITGLLHEAGVPEDVFIMAVGDGRVGQALVESKIDGIFFTGSYRTGALVASAAAHKMIPMQFELGGKDPVYVADDVDPAAVAASLADGAFYNNGQSCCAVERIYVHKDVFFAFEKAFLDTVAGFKMGRPDEEGTYLGPLTREAQIPVIQEQVDDALRKGATLACGGRRASLEGWYYEPTVLTDVNHDMAVMREESFGPIIGIQKVASDEEATELMNDTPYGLTAGVFSRDRTRATQILAQVRSGTSYWNCCDRVSPRLPWTGIGQSGVGSTLSREGIQAFLRPRGWHLRAPAN